MNWFNLFRPRLRRCSIQTRELSREDIARRCLQVSHSYQHIGLVNKFSLYRKVVDKLLSSSRIEFRPLCRLMDSVTDSRIVLSLRHDIDADVVSGISAARFLESRGVPGSFYLLHTSHYYGVIENNVFFRFSALQSFVDAFIETGCELGLHADPLHLFCQYGLDGSQAMKSELDWIRSCGAQIKGTVAHNSAVVYGMENFEVFKGRAIANRKGVRFNGCYVPLQQIDEQRLDLSYEGNYPILPDQLDKRAVDEYIWLSKGDGVRNGAWLELYFLYNPFFDRLYDVDIWLLGADAWVVAFRSGKKRVLWPINTDAMLSMITEIDTGLRVVMNIHPEYISREVEFCV